MLRRPVSFPVACELYYVAISHLSFLFQMHSACTCWASFVSAFSSYPCYHQHFHWWRYTCYRSRLLSLLSIWCTSIHMYSLRGLVSLLFTLDPPRLGYDCYCFPARVYLALYSYRRAASRPFAPAHCNSLKLSLYPRKVRSVRTFTYNSISAKSWEK